MTAHARFTPTAPLPAPVSRAVALRCADTSSQLGAACRAPASICGCVRLRLMTYNIMCGVHWPRIRDVIKAHPVDVLCLQEVAQPGHPLRGAVHPDRIRRDIPWPADLRMLWRKPPRQVGNMTLVRDGRIEATRTLRVPPGDAYGMVHDITVGGARLTLANIHATPMLGPTPITFIFSELMRLREACHLSATLRKSTGPVFAAGDFNSFWPAPAILAMNQTWRDARRIARGRRKSTRPTFGLPFRIDYVFHRGPVELIDYRVVDGSGSDHRAVLVELRVPASTSGL